METIAIVNQKGGCGKTTTSINLSACLAEQGKRVLLIDMDPQSHASLGLNITIGELDLGLYDALLSASDREGPLLDDIAQNIGENLDLVPSSIVLSAFEQKLSGAPGRETRLLKTIQRMKKQYDYILLDCPPSVGLLSFNALMAAQSVIIPLEPSFFSLHGLGKQIESIRMFSERLNHPLRIHTLITLFDRRTRLSREVFEEVKKHFPNNTFQSVIHMNVRLKEAASYGLPITEFDKKCTGYRDYRTLSQELLQIPAPQITEHRARHLGPHPVRNGFLFSYNAPHVQSLKLVGDFNNWTPDQNAELEKKEDGTWEKVVSLPPGTYHYKFIVDGEWKADPHNPKNAVNDFGSVDSIVEVRPVVFPELLQQNRKIRIPSEQEFLGA